MPFNGSGTFTPVYNWETDKANGIKIRADRMDGQDGDIADGLTDCVTRDGQSPATANLPMGGFKHTNVAAASSGTDYLRADQMQSNALTYFVATGTIDAYTLSPAPAVAAYTAGLSFFIRIPTSKGSTSTAPTLNVSGVGAKTITYGDGSALEYNDLVSDGVYEVMYNGTTWAMPNKNLPTIFAIKGVAEKTTISNTNATGTIQYDALTQAVLYYTTIASGNWTLNVRGDSTHSLDSVLAVGDDFSVIHKVKQGGSAFYNANLTVDGVAVTPKWQGGTAPSSGNASSVDVYRYQFTKLGAATWDCFAAKTKYA